MSLRDLAIMTAVCLLWAGNTIVSKYVVGILGVPPLFYGVLRFAVVTLAVIPWLLPMPRPRWRLVIVALLMGAGNFALVFIGLKTSTPSGVGVVSQIGVPITTLLSVLMLGERLRWQRTVGIVLTFAGALVVMWQPGGFALPPGLLFVAGSAACSSLGAVMMKQVQGIRPLEFQAWVGFISMWPLAALSVLLERDQFATASAGGLPFVLAVLFSSLIVSVGAHTAYYGLISRYEANLISPLTLMMPLFTIALGVAIYHDPFGPRQALGSAMALGGVLLIALRWNQLMAALMSLRSRDR